MIVCRSGHRSLRAGRTLKEMGFSNVRSLKTGLRGWNDYEMPMVRQDGEDPVIEANADKYLPHKSGKINLNRKKLKQDLRKIFSFAMPD